MSQKLTFRWHASYALSLLALSATAKAVQSPGDTQIIEAARHYADAIGIKLEPSETKVLRRAGVAFRGPTGSIGWMVQSRGALVILDKSGNLLAIRNDKRDTELRNRHNVVGKPMSGDSQSYWLTATSYLFRLGIDSSHFGHEQFRNWSDKPGASPDARGRVQLVFAPKPYGYDARNFGNSIAVELDAGDGALISMMRAVGWTYDRPGKLVAASEAARRARAVIQQEGNIHPTGMTRRFESEVSDIAKLSRSAKLLYADSNGMWGSKEGLTLNRSHHLRLLYEFTTPSMIIHIDATTGACLGGAIRDGGVDRRIRGLGH